MIQMLDSIDRQDIVVAVNVSPQELGRYSVADMVAHELANHGIAASRLEMEITEESMYSEERGGEDIRTLGCQTLQGYYFARPMPPRDLLRWLIAHEHELRMPPDPAVSQLMIA
eukprot:gene43248-54147_t